MSGRCGGPPVTSARKTEQRIPGAIWLATLVKLASSGFKWETLPQYMKWSMKISDVNFWSLQVHAHTHVPHTCESLHAYACTALHYTYNTLKKDSCPWARWEYTWGVHYHLLVDTCPFSGHLHGVHSELLFFYLRKTECFYQNVLKSEIGAPTF